MMLDLPAKCFISHSYADADAVKQLVAKLPPDVPFIFPQITVKPDEFVSNHLIEAILKCDGLIYLRDGMSEKSFWVTFERDYAIRAGKKVYSFDPVTLQIEPETSDPLDLAVFASYARRDSERVRKISEYLARERFFDIWLDSERVQVGENWKEVITEGIKGSLNRDGYLIAYSSEAAGKSKSVEEEIMLPIKATPKNNRTKIVSSLHSWKTVHCHPNTLPTLSSRPFNFMEMKNCRMHNDWTIWFCDCTGSSIATKKLRVGRIAMTKLNALQELQSATGEELRPFLGRTLSSSRSIASGMSPPTWMISVLLPRQEVERRMAWNFPF